jgi:adenylylsulfate kinase
MSNKEGFAVWITGIPAAGKSAVTRELANRLRERGLPIIVLESDELRKILTPEPVYTGDERDRFYGQLAGIDVVPI